MFGFEWLQQRFEKIENICVFFTFTYIYTMCITHAHIYVYTYTLYISILLCKYYLSLIQFHIFALNNCEGGKDFRSFLGWTFPIKLRRKGAKEVRKSCEKVPFLYD